MTLAGTTRPLCWAVVPMMATAAGICFVVTVGGLALSYRPEWPPGATIVELAAVCYLVAVGVRRLREMARRQRSVNSEQ